MGIGRLLLAPFHLRAVREVREGHQVRPLCRRLRDHALTRQQAELTDVALDCTLATADLLMERVVQLFESADAVKDPAALKKGSDGREPQAA